MIERSRRRRTVALAASVLGLVLLAGGGWTYLARQRVERSGRVDRATQGLELLYAEASRVGDDLTRWMTWHNALMACHAEKERSGTTLQLDLSDPRRHMPLPTRSRTWVKRSRQ